MPAILLRAGALSAVVLPEVAGALARLDWERGGARHALLRPWQGGPGAALPGTGELACFPLLPWSNRIDAAGFVFEGRRIAPPPNRAGEPCPIHGDGWQHPWQVGDRRDNEVELLLERGAGLPFSYRARLHYRLHHAALQVTLAVTNLGAATLPFGLGLHPWFERRAGVTLRARASGTWQRGPLGLPQQAIDLPPAWDFSTARSLPATQVDHAFRGWDGRAEIAWPDTGLALAIEADMDYFILYAPAGGAVFCFEPVDHPVNAHHLPGGAAANGLTALGPGQTLARRVSFRVQDERAGAQ